MTRYAYDNAYQLTRAEYPAGSIYNGEVHAWTYDPIGNRLTSSVNGTATSYAYQKLGTNPNNWQRMSSDGTSSYTYDANGNTITRGGDTYGWDYDNRLTSITGSAAATYKYDYQGRRTSKTTGGVTTTYLYDGLNLARESGAATTDYVFGSSIDEPLALSRGAAVSYFTADGLGSIALTADMAGTIQNGYAYDAWGVPRLTTEAQPQPFGYTARERGDVGSEWFYRARYYRSASSRFASEDLLSIVNARYAYVSNRPTVASDPFGLYRVHYSGSIHRTWDILTACNGGSLVGCTKSSSASLSCDCNCKNGLWFPEFTLHVTFQMYIWAGPDAEFAGKAHDTSIVDFMTAVEHEYKKHLYPAVDDAEKLTKANLDNLEQPVASEADCRQRCKTAKTLSPWANKLFKDALAATAAAND